MPTHAGIQTLFPCLIDANGRAPEKAKLQEK